MLCQLLAPWCSGLADKVCGKALYTADLRRSKILYGGVLRSPHAPARAVEIDTEPATGLAGIHAVLTHHEEPKVCLDSDLLPLDPVVRFVGDEVALVAVESEAIGEDVLCLISVRYEILLAVFETEAALQGAAPMIEEVIRWEAHRREWRCQSRL